jgi:hypothetical protein
VVLGLAAARHPHWLVERHKAERLRLLKYRFLTDPSLWSSGDTAPETRADWLRREVATIEQLDRGGLDKWLEDDEIPAVPAAFQTAPVASDILDELVAYYRRRRLDVQLAYFTDRFDRNRRLNEFSKLLPPALFFASVAAALAHFVYEFVAGDAGGQAASGFLVPLAATLAVIAAGVRTFRGAHELARNESRYRAKKVALENLSIQLAGETEPPVVFRNLWCCEQILESEHREWMRLMIDAEWSP